MTTNHPLIGRKVKMKHGSIYTVVGPVGFQPALLDGDISEFFVPVIDSEGYGANVSLSCVTVLDDKPAGEDERVAKLRALALVLTGAIAFASGDANGFSEDSAKEFADAYRAIGLSDEDGTKALIEKALAIIEASR